MKIHIIAIVLFSLLAGVLTDRLSRKKVMFWADFLRGILSVVIVFTTDSPLWFFAVILFVMGAGEAFIFPASGAILPSILPEDKFAFTICNPPFHASQDEATKAVLRKVNNLEDK